MIGRTARDVSPRRIDEEPGRPGPAARVGDGRRRAIGADHRMIGVEEVLAVIARGREARGQQLEHQFVGMRLRREAHFREHRLEDAEPVVADRVPRNLDRAFELAVEDRERRRGQVLDVPLADPLAQVGELAQPAIGFIARRTRRARSGTGIAIRSWLIGVLSQLSR